jgi:type I restriction enzyme S subunit
MSWQTISFHKFITLQRGFDLPRSKMKDGDVPVLGSNCIIGYHNEAKVDGPGVVTGRSGTLGLVQYAEVAYWPHNTALWVKDFRDNDPKFETLNLERFNGGVSVPTLNRNVLDTLKVKIPEQKIQSQIVSILSAYDDLLKNNRRRIQLLEQAAQFLYKEWFVHLRFPGHEHVKITDGVPEKWRKIGLGELCRLRAGGTFKPKYQGRLEGNLPFIKVRDLSREGNAIAITGADNWVTLDECEEFRGKPFSQGTSVFAKIGEGLRQNRVRLIVRDTLIDNNMMGAIPDQRVTVSEYLYFLLRGHDLASYAGGAAVPFLSAKVLEGMDVLAPPMQLLLLFHDAVTPMFHQIVNLEQQSAAAANARGLLLPRLMNGEIAI